jgi:hypothetical protein
MSMVILIDPTYHSMPAGTGSGVFVAALTSVVIPLSRIRESLETPDLSLGASLEQCLSRLDSICLPRPRTEFRQIFHSELLFFNRQFDISTSLSSRHSRHNYLSPWLPPTSPPRSTPPARTLRTCWPLRRISAPRTCKPIWSHMSGRHVPMASTSSILARPGMRTLPAHTHELPNFIILKFADSFENANITLIFLNSS